MSRQNVGREQAGEAEPAFEAARLWLQSRLPSWFSAFSILQDFFFSPLWWEMSPAKQGEDLLICIF